MPPKMKNEEENGQRKPVFLDTRGRRKQYSSYFSILAAITVSVLLTLFVVSVLINPFLPQIRLKPILVKPGQSDIVPRPPVPDLPSLIKPDPLLKQTSDKARAEQKKRDDTRIQARVTRELLAASRIGVTTTRAATMDRPLAIGFYVNWDDSSLASLKKNIQAMDWVVPEWIRLSGDAKNPLVLDIDPDALDLISTEKPSMPVLPLLQNYRAEQWNSDILVNSISTDDTRRQLINSLLETIDKYKFAGLTIDIEEVPPASQMNLLKFMQELHAEFQSRNLILAQAVPFDNPDWNYVAYANVTDYLMLMAYDQHWSTGEAGPIAGQDWYESILKKRMAELSPAKTIICFGNYGYNWAEGEKEGETVSFQEALMDAKDSLDGPGEIKFDAASKNPFFSYDEDDGKTHTVWFLDAVTAFNELQSAKPYNVAGFALWRLGSEDPSLWNVFGSQDRAVSADDLRTIKYGYDVDFQGTGEILQVIAQPQDGVRELIKGKPERSHPKPTSRYLRRM